MEKILRINRTNCIHTPKRRNRTGIVYSNNLLLARISMDLSFSPPQSASRKSHRQEKDEYGIMLQKAIHLASKVNVQLQKLQRLRSNTALNRIALANALVLERLAECNQQKFVTKEVKPVRLIINQLLTVLEALLSLTLDYVQQKNNYYCQYLEKY